LVIQSAVAKLGARRDRTSLIARAQYVNALIGIAFAGLSLNGVQPCCHFSRFTLSLPNAVMDCALNF
jgi:hypothetical protein